MSATSHVTPALAVSISGIHRTYNNSASQSRNKQKHATVLATLPPIGLPSAGVKPALLPSRVGVCLKEDGELLKGTVATITVLRVTRLSTSSL
jgi:hypothetical protein